MNYVGIKPEGIAAQMGNLSYVDGGVLVLHYGTALW